MKHFCFQMGERARAPLLLVSSPSRSSGYDSWFSSRLRRFNSWAGNYNLSSGPLTAVPPRSHSHHQIYYSELVLRKESDELSGHLQQPCFWHGKGGNEVHIQQEEICSMNDGKSIQCCGDKRYGGGFQVKTWTEHTLPPEAHKPRGKETFKDIKHKDRENRKGGPSNRISSSWKPGWPVLPDSADSRQPKAENQPLFIQQNP